MEITLTKMSHVQKTISLIRTHRIHQTAHLKFPSAFNTNFIIVLNHLEEISFSKQIEITLNSNILRKK